jgi:hypothetical protein
MWMGVREWASSSSAMMTKVGLFSLWKVVSAGLRRAESSGQLAAQEIK